MSSSGTPAFSPSTLQHLKKTEKLYLASGLGENADNFFKSLRMELTSCADAAMAMRNFLRFVEASFNSATLFRDITRHTVLLETLIKVFSTSQFFSDILIRDPELFHWLTATNVLEKNKARFEFSAGARQTAGIFNTPEKKFNALKRFQRREILRIGIRDIFALADLIVTTRELSYLADAIIQCVADILWHEMAEKYGSMPQTEWAIVGLGKLGGEELNYSSDIDIIGVFDEDKEFTVQAEKKITNGEYFIQFIERIIQTLTAVTEEGYFYRVDARLRPDGNFSPLIRSFAATMTYYESRGELWERQMLIKARCTAGSKPFGERFLNSLLPFVYPRTFFRNPIEEISAIKGRIEAKSSDENNIKLKAGGIRDIEFIVQALQLLNAGVVPEIREGGTLPALEALRQHSFLWEEEEESLRSAYIFFRTAEHRLQMMDYEQTHTIPTEKEEREKLARRMDLSREEFERKLRDHLSTVRSIFNSVFSQTVLQGASSLDRLLAEKEDSDFVRSYCLRLGFSNPRETVRRLRRMMYGSNLEGFKEYTEQTRTHFRNIAEVLLDDIAHSPSPERTLANCEKIISSFTAIDSLYATFGEKKFRSAFVTVCARSSRIARILSRSPELTEMMITQINQIVAPPALSVPEYSSLYQWKMKMELHAAIRYTVGESDERTLFESLSAIAAMVLGSIYEEERRRLGISLDAEFCIMGLGKLGGGEMNFDSDIDVVFLCNPKKGEDTSLFEHLSYKIIETASQATASGVLYNVDARLRPEGRSAPLAAAADAYFGYLRKRASLWERQSLTRARMVAGNAVFGEKILNAVHRYVYESPFPNKWQQEILSMRKKTEGRGRATSSDFVDIKFGAGGLMDIEFCVQALQLARKADSFPATNVFQLLDLFTEEKQFAEEISVLQKNYRSLRKVETLLRLGLDTQSNVLSADDESLPYLAVLCGRTSEKDLVASIRAEMKETRTVFNTIMSSLQ